MLQLQLPLPLQPSLAVFFKKAGAEKCDVLGQDLVQLCVMWLCALTGFGCFAIGF